MRLLARVEAAGERAAKARAELAQARAELEEACLAAVDEGIAAAKVARAAQLSRERVRQMVERRRGG